MSSPPERHAAVLEALDQQIGDPFLPDPFRTPVTRTGERSVGPS